MVKKGNLPLSEISSTELKHGILIYNVELIKLSHLVRKLRLLKTISNKI